ncbi:ARM repeat-containing protein [Scleroderma citrinum]
MIRNMDRTEVSLESLKKHSSYPSTTLIPLHSSIAAKSVCIESEEEKQRQRGQEKRDEEEMRKAEEHWQLEEAEREHEDKAIQLEEKCLEEKDSLSLPLSAFITARKIDRLDKIKYPDGIRGPKAQLNRNAEDGKFRYDRDFLLQFMAVCRGKPPNLPPLEALEISRSSYNMTHGGHGRHHQTCAAILASGAHSPSDALDIAGFKTGVPPNQFTMGQFSTPGSKLTSEERFMITPGAPSAPVCSGPTAPLNHPEMTSQGGHTGKKRIRTKRGEKRKSAPVQRGPGSGSGLLATAPTPFLEPIKPLETSANRWVPMSTQQKAVEPDTSEIVVGKIVTWVNTSENERDGRTLIQVIGLIFERAISEATRNEMHARLCHKIMETISPRIQDDSTKSSDGKPIAGGQLFRKCLLGRCKEDFERGWASKKTTARTAVTNETKGDKNKTELSVDEYCAAQKAKHRGLNLVKFIGELFKLQMLTERIMHESVKKLLGNAEDFAEVELEKLCQLLRIIGQLLDVPKARAHMDVYFSKMRNLCKSGSLSPRMQFMFQDVIELRDRKWQPRNTVKSPMTAEVYRATYPRECSKSEGDRGKHMVFGTIPGLNGWELASDLQPRPPPKAGDLSQFGKITKGAPMVMGPSSVFAGKREGKRESMTPTNPSSNMFSMLSQNPELSSGPKSNRASSRKTSTDLDKPEPTLQRKRLQLLPRTKLVLGDFGPTVSEDGPKSAPTAQMSEANAKKRIDEDVKEFFAVRNLEEADVYFTALTEEYRFRLVDKLIASALESKEADARLVAEFFARPASQRECSPEAFEAGFIPMVELLEDIAIDAPKAFDYMTIMLKGAGFDRDEERLKRIVATTMDSDRLYQGVMDLALPSASLPYQASSHKSCRH